MTAKIIFIVAGAVAVVFAMWGFGKMMEAKRKDEPSDAASADS